MRSPDSQLIDEYRKDNWAQVRAVLAAVSAVAGPAAWALYAVLNRDREPALHDYLGGRGAIVLGLGGWAAIGIAFVCAALSGIGGVAQLVLGHQPFARVWKWWLLAVASAGGLVLLLGPF